MRSWRIVFLMFIIAFMTGCSDSGYMPERKYSCDELRGNCTITGYYCRSPMVLGSNQDRYPRCYMPTDNPDVIVPKKQDRLQ